MCKIFQLLNWMQGDGRRGALFLGLGAVGILLAALYYQYVEHLLPCELCYIERVPHVLIAIFGLLTFWVKRARLRVGLMVFLAFLAFVDTGISLYHVGIEERLWAAPGACASDLSLATTVEEARNQILNATVSIPCDIVVWRFLGISMAGWNAIICFCMGLWAVFGVYRSRQAADV